MFVFFPYFSRIMEIHFSQVLGIVWISALSEMFIKKPINLNCLCFSILFPYNGNPLFPCFGNCMDFRIMGNISETLNFEMFVLLCFLIFFPYYGNSLFPYFGNCMNFCFTQNIWETLECLFFSPYFSRIHILGVECINTTHEVCKKPIALKCLCFPILFSLTTRIQLFSMFLELYGFLVD